MFFLQPQSEYFPLIFKPGFVLTFGFRASLQQNLALQPSYVMKTVRSLFHAIFLLPQETQATPRYCYCLLQ